MNPDLLKWLGCGLVALLGLLAVTRLPPGPVEPLRGVERAADPQAASATRHVAQAGRSQP
jgi:hypothetical protein